MRLVFTCTLVMAPARPSTPWELTKLEPTLKIGSRSPFSYSVGTEAGFWGMVVIFTFQLVSWPVPSGLTIVSFHCPLGFSPPKAPRGRSGHNGDLATLAA